MGETVQYRIENRVAWITLDRPEKRNAINVRMRKELQDAFEDVKYNPDVWVAVLTGEGPVFCAGKDLTEVAPWENRGVLSNTALHHYQMNIFKPFICALNGGAYAQGVGFALNSDIIIMSERASFGWPHVKRGISSISGPTRGVHILPWHVAMKHLMLGEQLSAADCLRWGIATEVVAHEELLPTARRYAEAILESAPLAVRAIKEVARRAYDLPLPERMQLAELIVERIDRSEDRQEGIQAFREKRKPVWRAR
ncbi:MAG: enoyl-CoA hydratase/isomerase family protein [Betaproteobacteria bacterium]|nr:enoyl-CoA hydratase/isomerase family protein [Betaproteobacteria bacterium]